MSYWKGSSYLLWDKKKELPTKQKVLDFEEERRLRSCL